MTDTTAGEGVRMFGPEVENVQSRYIIVHQLRASADIQSAEVTERMGRKATTDRATLMREAADLIEALAAQPSAGAQVDFESGYARNTVVNIVERHISGWAGDHADNPYDAAPIIAREIFDALVTPAQPDTGDVAALREALVRELDHLIMHIVAIGPDDPKKKGTDREYEIPMARRVWREVAIDAILAALSKPNAQGREG